MADAKPQAQAQSQATPKPGKPEVEPGPETETQVEAAMLDMRLAAEEQWSEATAASNRLAEELSQSVSTAMQQFSETALGMSDMHADAMRRFIACKTPQEMIDCQQEYWKAWMEQALTGSRRMVEAQASVMPAVQNAFQPLLRHYVQHMERAGRVH